MAFQSRIGSVLQGRGQASALSSAFGIMGMVDRMQRMIKRVVGRQIDPRVLTELAKIKIELIIWEGTPSESMKTVTSVVLTSPDVKILSFVKKLDHSTLGTSGKMMSDILSLGIEDLAVPEYGDDWKDLMVDARIHYAVDKTTAESIFLRFSGVGAHVRIYYDGVLAHESQQALGKYITFFEKEVSLAAA